MGNQRLPGCGYYKVPQLRFLTIEVSPGCRVAVQNRFSALVLQREGALLASRRHCLLRVGVPLGSAAGALEALAQKRLLEIKRERGRRKRGKKQEESEVS